MTLKKSLSFKNLRSSSRVIYAITRLRVFRIIYGISYFIIIFSFHQENIRMMAFNFSVNAQKSKRFIHMQSPLRKSVKTSDAALEQSAFAARSPSCIMALNSASVISTRTSVSEISCCFSIPSTKFPTLGSAWVVKVTVLVSKRIASHLSPAYMNTPKIAINFAALKATSFL